MRSFGSNTNAEDSASNPTYLTIDRGLTLAIAKSLNTPLPLPPSIHRFRICVGRVYACICDSSNCACARIR